MRKRPNKNTLYSGVSGRETVGLGIDASIYWISCFKQPPNDRKSSLSEYSTDIPSFAPCSAERSEGSLSTAKTPLAILGQVSSLNSRKAGYLLMIILTVCRRRAAAQAEQGRISR